MRNVHNSVIIMYKKREGEGIGRRLDLLRICVTPMKFQIFVTPSENRCLSQKMGMVISL